MFNKQFLDKLREKYNYSDKIINALAKIIPNMTEYYGAEHEITIFDAILNCEIIPCTSKQTISKVLKERKLTNLVGDSFLGDIDKKRAESVYCPNVEIIYNEEKNIFEINKIDRVIVTSHTFNYDSPKGLEVLTHALCHLVKSYKNEFTIDENVLTIKSGISYEKRKIKKEDEIYLEFIEDYGKGLEEGFNIFDTENIVSMVLGDTYKCYDFDAVYTIAKILKEKFKLLDEINYYEMTGAFKEFKKLCKNDTLDKLVEMCDNCINLENEMFLSFTREDKDKLANLLRRKLDEEGYGYLIEIYKNKKENIKA